jgi:glycosyltransferase involved in cell wall biosynthesis
MHGGPAVNVLWLTVAELDAPGFRSTQFGMANALSDLGVDVRLMGKSSNPAFKRPEGFKGQITLVPRKGRPLTEFLYHIALWRTLLKGHVDIAMFEPLQFRLILAPALLSRIGLVRTEFVLDVRTPLVDKALKSRAERLNYYLCMKFARYFLKGITVITEGLKKDLEPLFGKEKTVAIWESAVDERAFNPATTRPVKKDEIGLGNRFLFLYHGSLSANRGLNDLISAMARLKTEQPHAALLFLGKGIDSEALKGRVKALGLKDTVFFLSPVDNSLVPAYIAMADVGVIPLPNDRCWQVSSPLKLFEYLAMERPVLVSDIAAHRDVIGDAPYAVYAKEVSAEGLYDALKSCIKNFRALKEKAPLGRTLVLKNHTWNARARALKDYLLSIKGEGRGRLS